MSRLLLTIFCSTSLLFSATYEEQAIQISAAIQAKHTPFGSVLNPMYTSATSSDLLTYTRCGDSAIWTGHWLAAESFRYAVTRTPEALEAARRALTGIQLLVDVTGSSNLLARCALRADSPFSAGPLSEERAHGQFQGRFENTDYYWIGDTSRDQYLGVFFGLAAAYENIPDSNVRTTIAAIATKLLDRLIAKDWSVVMPDGSISTVFWLRPDQQLAMLQVGRQVNPVRYAKAYEDKRSSAFGLSLIMTLEANEESDSYFKFNLDAITWYTLIHLEESMSSKRVSYLDAYRIFRQAVASHGNAFFNVVDRALQGANSGRDSETQDLMSAWLLRPTRDVYVDLRGKYKACGDNRACDPVPVAERVPTDFLWQRSPFQMYGGGTGQIESAGIDFILPYWMGRANGLDFSLLAVSAADGSSALAPGSIATLFGSGFAPDSTVRVTDASGLEGPASILFSSAGQINFVVPSASAPGPVKISVVKADGSVTHVTTVTLNLIAPAIFSANASGRGPAAAIAFQPSSAGVLMPVSAFRCSGPLLCVTQPLQPADGRPVYVSLYGTGISGYRSGVTAKFNGEAIPVLFAGPQGQFEGLDQVNIRFDSTLRSRGEADVVLTVDGLSSNPVRLMVR